MAIDVLQRMMNSISYNPLTGDFFWKDGLKRQTKRPLGWKNPSGHVRIDFEQKKYYAHRLAIAFVTGAWPIAEVDHINLDPSDNRIENLRECSHSQNSRNSPRRAHSQQPYKGVRKSRGGNRWCARIRFNRREIYLGAFDTPEMAFEAYKTAAVNLHGDFARFA